MKKICLLVFAALVLSSCKIVSVSPTVIYRNSSPDGGEVRNVQVVWNGYYLLKESGPLTLCGSGGGQDFGINGLQSNFFGPVHAEWENSKGEKISKDFVIKKEDFPGYWKNLAYVMLFFTQTDVEYYTSDNPRLKEIEREKRGNWTIKWFEKEYTHKCVNDPKEVKRVRDKFKN